MKLRITPGSFLTRFAIALVWLYEGLWSKLLARSPHHAAMVRAVPFFTAGAARAALIALGLAECAIAAWVLWGRHMRSAALAETCLLIAMNAGGLIWAWRLIPDPGGMVVQNFAFLILIWIAAEDRPYASQN